MRKGLSVIVGIAILLFAYSASAAVETEGLVSWWKLDGDATDSWTNNNGTLKGNPVYTTTDTAGSESSGALIFDGDGDSVDCGDDTTLAITNKLTLEAWVKSDFDSNWHTIASKGFAYSMSVTPENRFTFFSKNGTNNIEYQHVNSSPYENTWTHLAMTIDPSRDTNLIVYINGVEVGTAHNDAYVGPEINVSTFLIGELYATDRYFKGNIDEVRVYDRALTGGEILGNYNAIPEPSTFLLLGGGLLGLLVLRRGRKQ